MLIGPTPAGIEPLPYRMAAVTLLMAVLWMTQAIPMAVTALIPLVAFPLLGIQSAEKVSKSYIDQNVLLFLGGFIIAMGIEKWGLHRRMALHIVRVLGTGLRRVVLGFMVATGFLSMWISNTASTLLMLPIGLAMIASIRDILLDGEDTPESHKKNRATLDRFASVLMIAIAYAASIGGFTSLVGTPTNVQFVGSFAKEFPAAQYPDVPVLSAGEWLLSVVPIGVLLLFSAWAILTFRLPSRIAGKTIDRRFFTERLRKLGPPTRAEWLMLIIFAVTAALWVFRKPLTLGGAELVPGWGNRLAASLSSWGVKPAMIHDSTVAIGMAILMFAIPAKRDESGGFQCLMDWETVERLPWGILLLIGGGFAIAGGFRDSQLAEWLGNEFSASVADWPTWLLVAAVCFLLTFLTELTSNVATVGTLMPILAATALKLEIDPLLIMIPATISASCAFMLPIATPPNAIVFGSGRIRMQQMAVYGLVLNLIGVVVITVATFVLIGPQLGLTVEGLPDWLQSAVKK